MLEDDAQNGPDHVDAHRSAALVISPYTKSGLVDSTMYSTSSMLRTMELILGLKPMSQFDAAAHPMFHSFQTNPDLSAYEHVVPEVDLKEKNKATAWGSKLSECSIWPRRISRRRSAVQRGDLAFGEGSEFADAGSCAGGVCDAQCEEG